MILVIDAYNILKQTHASSVISDSQRTRFIHDLNGYAAGRNLKPLVIFDGGPSRWPMSEVYGIVQVVYAGSGQSADAYILDYIERSKHKDLLLVSSDAALNQAAAHYEVPSIDALLFWTLMQRAFKERTRKQTTPTLPIKLTHEDNPELDALMMATTTWHAKLDDQELLTIMEHTHNRISKNDRKLMAKLKKLL